MRAAIKHHDFTNNVHYHFAANKQKFDKKLKKSSTGKNSKFKYGFVIKLTNNSYTSIKIHEKNRASITTLSYD